MGVGERDAMGVAARESARPAMGVGDRDATGVGARESARPAMGVGERDASGVKVCGTCAMPVADSASAADGEGTMARDAGKCTA